MLRIKVDAPAEMHTHLREGDDLGPLVELSIGGGADVLLPMPNTMKGLRTADQVLAYIEYARIFVPVNMPVTFIPTLAITPETTEQVVEECVAKGIVDAKVYPLQRTTNSDFGVRHYGRLLPLFKRCGQIGVKLHFHPEYPWMEFSNRDAELAFLPIADIVLNESEAVVVWEHGTDGRCVPFWEEAAKSGRFFVTLTPHHLATNEDDVLGDVRAVCKPPIKTKEDCRRLVNLVARDYEWVMAGSDSAFHSQDKKHPHVGRCACGAFTAPFAPALYAHALHPVLNLEAQEGREIFERFLSRNARRLHQLPAASRQIVLTKQEFQIPETYHVGSKLAEPFWAGQKIDWTVSLDLEFL